MATSDKAKNTAQQAKGKLKETVGKASGNNKLRAEGKADQVKGNVKQAGEKQGRLQEVTRLQIAINASDVVGPSVTPRRREEG